MKALLLSFLFLFILCTTVNAQWAKQHTFTGTEYLWLTEAVDENVCWGSVIYNSSLNLAGYIKTTDGGNIWQIDTLPNNWHEYSIHPRDANVAYFGIIDLSNVGRMIKTTDGGSTWFAQSTAYGNVGSWPNFIHFFDDNNGFTQGDPIAGYLEMYTTTNAGNNWIPVPPGHMPPTLTNEYAMNTAVDAVGDTIWIPVSKLNTNEFRIFKSIDRGQNWTISSQFTLTFSGGYLTPTSLAFRNGLEGILIASDFYSSGSTGSNYKILKTTDGGNTWPEISFPLSIDPIFISEVPGTTQSYLVTAPINNHGSAYTSDGGNNWEMIEDNLDLCLPKCISPTTGWATSWASPSIYKWSGTSAVEDETAILTEFSLEQNYPNPFNPLTKIKYSVPQSSKVVLKVFDVLGNEIETLVNEEKHTGTYELTWTAADLPSGLYFYQLKAGSFVQTKKMILMK